MMDLLGTVAKLAVDENLDTTHMEERVLGVKVFVNHRLQTVLGKYKCRRQIVSWSSVKIVSEWIELNPLVFNDADSYRDTLAHEIGHAMTPGESHNWKWKEAVRAIGGKPSRLAEMEECARIGMSGPKIKVIAYCQKCGYEVRRIRGLRKGRTYTHRGCGGAIVNK